MQLTWHHLALRRLLHFRQAGLEFLLLAPGLFIGCSDDRDPTTPSDAALPVPANVGVAERTPTSVTLEWSNVAGEVSGFEAERTLGPSGTPHIIPVAPTGAARVSFTDVGLPERNDILYRVRAVRASEVSNWSPVLTTRTPPVAPQVVRSGNTDRNEIEIYWEMAPPAVDGFEVQRRVDGGDWIAIASTTATDRSFADRGLLFGASYTYRVRCFARGDSSAWSTTVHTPNDQPRGGPAELASALLAACRDRDHAAFIRQLDPEFEFLFSRRDRERQPCLPYQWGAEAFGRAAAVLFADRSVSSYAVNFFASRALPPAPGEAAPWGSWKLLLVSFDYDVTTVAEDGLERVFRIRDANIEQLWIRPTVTDSTAGGAWRIVRWEESSIEPNGAPESDRATELEDRHSLGELLRFYSYRTNDPQADRLPRGLATVVNTSHDSCGVNATHSDGSFETAIRWDKAAGRHTPLSAGIAERFDLPYGAVCSVALRLTQTKPVANPVLSIAILDEEDDAPHYITCMRETIDVGPLATWPSVSEVVVTLDGCCVSGPFWVSVLNAWAVEPTDWYLVADLDGTPGRAMTMVPDDSECAAGWRSVSDVFGSIHALGISVQMADCGGVGGGLRRRDDR